MIKALGRGGSLHKYFESTCTYKTEDQLTFSKFGPDAGCATACNLEQTLLSVPSIA